MFHLLFVLAVSFSNIYTNTVSNTFKVPKGLEQYVDFWIKIFTDYDINELVLHDAKYNIIYEAIDISDIKGLELLSDRVKQEIINSRVLRVKEKYRQALMSLSRGVNPNSEPLLKRLYSLYLNVNEKNKYLNASRAGRMRVQSGMRANFRRAIYYSYYHIDNMERIFRRFGLPTELARIPFIESFFNPKATSHKSAAGVWQFMPATGREYMKVSNIYDERRDPYISTIAAARMLKKAYRYLGDWSLAVTAFNYGMYGLKKAKQKTGAKNIVDLIRRYNGKNFGYASKNYYAEFLAALFVEKYSVMYFGKIPKPKKLLSRYITIKKPMSFVQLNLLLGVDANTLKRYNPAISSYFYAGGYRLPKGAKIRLPKYYVRHFYADSHLRRFFNL